MPSKKKTKDGSMNELQQESVLEAVVIADSFNSNFSPISRVKSRCLFPVANQLVLSYTLEFLSSWGVKKIYLYCCHCASQIKEYLQTSKWTKETSPCIVTLVVSSDFTSVGDVMRDVEQKSLFESDYLLVPGDIISNVDLKQALDEHKARKLEDKNGPLVTMLMVKSLPNQLSRSSSDNIAVVCDRVSNRLLRFSKLTGAKASVDIPLNSMRKHTNTLEIRYDLVDTGIWICTPQVSQLFTDNFDYQTQEDFIKGILLNEEFLGKQIHMHVVQSRYCARINSFHSYGVVSRDFVSRWIYPFVPELNVEESSENSKGPCEGYRSLRHNVYLHSSCVLGSGSVIAKNTVIGQNSTIGNRCKITNAVIGNDCRIGDDCVISGSYIWNTVTVKENCQISNSLVCDKVTLHDSVELKSGCILCDEVVVGPDKVFPEDSVIYLIGPESDDFEESSAKEKPFDVQEVGAMGKGYVWNDEESDDESDSSLVKRLWGLSLQEHNNLLDRDREDEETSSEASSVLSSDDDGHELIAVDDDYSIFQREVKESLQGGLSETVQCENLILEINSSKYAYNMSMRDVVQVVTKTLFEIAYLEDPNTAQYFGTLKKILVYFLPLLCNYNKTASSQLDCLYTLEELAASHEHVANCLVKILMFLYDNDVLSEQVILHWNSKPTLSYLAIFTPEQIRTKVSKFIQWLQEAEEEEDSDD